MNRTRSRPVPWFAGSAQLLADRHQQATYIATRTDCFGSDDVILFACEIEDADLPNILFGFEPSGRQHA